MTITIHAGASEPPSKAERDKLARLAEERAIPQRGVRDSTDTMLDTVDAIIAGTGGTRLDARQLATWLAAFPRKEDAGRVQAWQQWNPGRVRAIADAVMLGGQGPSAVAFSHGTNQATVEAIVKAARAEIRRSK
jgi:hypothetical protein